MTAVFFDQGSRERTLLEIGLTSDEAPLGDTVPVDVFGSSLESQTRVDLEVEACAHFHERQGSNAPVVLIRGVGMTGVYLAQDAT